jgi:hypothetical protein
VIANFSNANGVAWPSVQTLSKMTGWPERTVQRAIRELEAIGELVVQIGGSHKSNRYRVTLTDGHPDGASGMTERQGGGDPGSGGGVTESHPNQRYKENKTKRAAASSFPRGAAAPAAKWNLF